MLGGKTGSKIKNVSNGIRVDSSVYGSCIPVVIGRTRCSGKMIFAGNYRTHKSSVKKGGGKKGKETAYSGNFDWLLGFAPINWVGDIWRNKDNFWPVGIGFQTFTVSPPSDYTISNNPGKVLGIIGVTGSKIVNATFNDFGAPGGSVISETESNVPVYPQGQSAFVFAGIGYMAPGGNDWGRWNMEVWRVEDISGGTMTIGVTGSSTGLIEPITIFYFYQLQSKSPISSAGLQYEIELGSGDEYNFSGGTQFQIEYPEFSGFAASDLDMGTGNSAPNDNLELVGLYALNQNGDANPADVILDIILPGNPFSVNGQTTGFNWNHGLSFRQTIAPDGTPTRPNTLTDPPVLP